MPEIKWLGHGCFRIRGREAVILMDPVPPESGYTMARQQADIVTFSHAEDAEGPVLDQLQPGFRAVTGPGEYEIREVFITGIRTHAKSGAAEPRGYNTVYVVEFEDLVFCHLGDLDHALTEEQAESLNQIDILFIPVGGPPTLNAVQAVEVIGQLEPSVVIPMQFRTAEGDHQRETLERFLKEMGVDESEPVDRFSVKKSDLGESMRVVVLHP
ncbi:MBL fold metallo-hydrolase [Nitrolancea hollandica]|uniref:Zn-dependent hydrolase of the beta-lactamase fold-like protein n=1 Tax=Nitrolancea hollandica Lb TaxID=1129897 RepID=I4EEX3_9BACT|nr:MBL fold metallo-hydrolase [Nitrolancea hollandica]CCF83235.1 Zn-dependent hydrolase of the beta-lactamase fold-like protein [Nitrolancea hollandica Lb]